MAGKIERTDNRCGIGEKEGKSQQNSVEADQDAINGTAAHITPLLVDANRGARILGVSLSHFYKFMRKNTCAPLIPIGALQMWRREDLLRFTGKPDAPPQNRDDCLIDAQAIAALCSISRSMVYKMNEQEALPQPVLDGRTLRWSFQEIEDWVENGCPPRRPPARRKARK